MAVDRDETLKKVEQLLKQGKLPGAIEEYIRLVEDRPGDWNLANSLGDLYVKAGNTDRAAEQFRKVADHLYDEGFLPRASAVYKKVLKVRSDDDHAIWQLADIAGRQGLGVDARAHYGRLIQDRRAAGNQTGAIDCVVRLGQLQDADVDARMVSARILVERNESKTAAGLIASAADLLIKGGHLPEARELLGQAASLDPENQEIRDRVDALGPAEGAPVVEIAADSEIAPAEIAPVAESEPEGISVEHVEEPEIVSSIEYASEPEVVSPIEPVDEPEMAEELEEEVLVALDEDPAAVLAQVVAAPDERAPAPEPLLLESVFEELTDRVARQQEERARDQGEPGHGPVDE